MAELNWNVAVPTNWCCRDELTPKTATVSDSDNLVTGAERRS